MAAIGGLASLRTYFNSGATRSLKFRRVQLKKLKASIMEHEQELNTALFADLKKSPEEVWATETGLVIAELNVAIRNLHGWMEPEHVPTNLLNLPSRSSIWSEPLGVVLIIGPWNYPFHLLINPLVGAIAAGNCAVLKASEFAPATAAVMQKIIESIFEKDYIAFVQGEGSVVIPEMIEGFSFDHIFYTGSTTVGKLIYKMAAEHLSPVTLELGGKSPCVVEADANLKVAAKRIALAKFSNAGQMCVAPDYLLVHSSVKEELIENILRSLSIFFKGSPQSSDNYGKIINQKQFDRIIQYMGTGKLVTGGRYDRASLFIKPTIITDVPQDSPLMREEIFGPILPVLTFETREEALQIIEKNKNPLAFYIYTGSNKNANEWIALVPAGGCCVNNSSWHLTNHHLPFGGRGFSGSGRYHGKFSFDTFSHKKAVMKTPTWFDPWIKYPPFKGKLKLFKWIIK